MLKLISEKQRKMVRLLSFAFLMFVGWVVVTSAIGNESLFHLFVRKMPMGDKIGHFLLFGILTYSANIISKFQTWWVWKLSFLKGSIYVFVFVLVDEFSQLFFTYRQFDVFDLIANFVGIAFFSYLSLLRRGRHEKNEN